METKEALDRIKADLAELRNQGQEAVQIEALDQYLTNLQANASDSLKLNCRPVINSSLYHSLCHSTQDVGLLTYKAGFAILHHKKRLLINWF